MSTWMDEFDKVEKDDVEFKAIPDGMYHMIVSDATLDETREVPRVSIELQISQGDFEGRKVWSNSMLKDKGHFFLKKNLIALGVEDPKSVNLVEDLASIVGKKCTGTTQQREFVGRDGQPRKAVNVYIDGLVDPDIPTTDAGDEIGF